MAPHDLAEHITTVLTIFGAVFSILLILIGFIMSRVWKNIDILHTKVDEFIRLHYECQANLPKLFMGREWLIEWHEFLEKREKQWSEFIRAFNNHRHDPQSGSVIRRNGDLP